MKLIRGEDRLYRSPLLEAETWVEHSFGTAVAAPEPGYLVLKQVHSCQVAEAGEWREGLEADGLITDRPGEKVGVKTADCVPVLLADPVRRAVAAVHAGWRGTVAEIAGAAVQEMKRRYGTRAEDLVAVLGPSIGPCCFEVGREVGEQFRHFFPEWGEMTPRRVDLREANRRVLAGAGVRQERIGAEAPCTFCGAEEFHSWRRDRQAGRRMYSVIGIKI